MIATEYLLNPDDPEATYLYLRRMEQLDGTVLWAIYQSESAVWNRSTSGFVHEPRPSSRQPRHLRTTRFTWEQAQAEAERAVSERRRWYAEVLALHARRST